MLLLFTNEDHNATLRSGTLVPRVEARVVYDTLSNTCLQKYKFLLTSAQELAEICQKKLQIPNFSAGDVRKWWIIHGHSALILQIPSFVTDFFLNFGFAEVTLSRKYSNKFGISLDFS